MRKIKVIGLVLAAALLCACGKKEETVEVAQETIIQNVEIMGQVGISGHPSGLAIKGESTLLVADTLNKVIWQINDNKVSIYAGEIGPLDEMGAPYGGYLDTNLENARFKSPMGISEFLGGYAIADSLNGIIRWMDEETVRTADWKSEENKLSNPVGLATDDDGNIFISDAAEGKIYKMDVNGNLSVFAEGFNEPTGICYKKGVLYVCDTGNHRICSVGGGSVVTIAGDGEGQMDGPVSQALFSSPQGVAVDDKGAIYVADTGNGSVRKIANGSVHTLLFGANSESTWPASPCALIVNNDKLIVADSFSGIIFTVSTED